MATYEQIFAIALANEMHAAAASMDLAYIRWLCAVDARRVAGEWAAVTNTPHDERFIEAVREEYLIACSESDGSLADIDFAGWCLEHSFTVY